MRIKMTEENFSDMGRVEAISRLYEGTPFKPFSSAWFETGGQAYVTNSSRVFLEGIDFDLVYFPLKHLGYKCVTVVTGELYAEFSHPRVLSVQLGISSKLDFSHIRELWGGIVSAAREHSYSQVALDLVPSRNGLTVSLSATGETSILMGKRRPAPKSKDLICVSGSMGAAFFGFKVLEKGRQDFDSGKTPESMEKYRMMVGAYLKPELNPSVVSQMEDADIVASCGYLVTRGLADTVKRLVRDTGLGAKIYADKIPFEGNSFDLGKEMDIDPISAAMNGGEDNKLLFTIPILKLEKFRREFQTFDIIGHLAQPEAGAVLVTPDGVELPIHAQGWKEDE